jgi:hypothetical protein
MRTLSKKTCAVSDDRIPCTLVFKNEYQHNIGQKWFGKETVACTIFLILLVDMPGVFIGTQINDLLAWAGPSLVFASRHIQSA